MSDAVLLLLPEVLDPADATACWWRLSGGAVVAEGTDAGWRTGDIPLIALAPVAASPLDWPEPQGETDKQRLGIARAAALQQGMADPATLTPWPGRSRASLP
jgi:hypothetical protein